MKRLQSTVFAIALTLSLSIVSFGGTITGSRTTSVGTITGSRVGTITGSRAGTITGSRVGTITGSRAGTITGSAPIANDSLEGAEDFVSRLFRLMLLMTW